MKLLAFAATNSTQSINKALVTYASQLIEADTTILDLNDYEMPIYSADRESKDGIPALAHDFYNHISNADALVISFAEYNGSYTAAFKNIFDWVSRIEQKLYQNKPMVLLSSSPGPGGAKNVLTAAVTSTPHFAGDVKAYVSIPSFYDNFDMKEGKIVNEDLSKTLLSGMSTLIKH